MADPTPLLASVPGSEEQAYRPLSGTALASFIVAAGYAVLFVALSVLAFLLKTPLTLGIWTLVFPVIALVLGLIGRSQIRASQGARSGTLLAAWGIRLSVLCGFSFLAFYIGSSIAVRMQAEAFVQQWFEKIRQGQLNEAFVETQDPVVRLSDDPKDERRLRLRYEIVGDTGTKGALPLFRESEVVRLLRQTSKDDVVPLGIKDQDYKAGGYQLELSYALTTPEGKYEIVVPVRSRESPQYRGRRWQVIGTDPRLTEPAKGELTPLGETLDTWRQLARNFTTEWLTALTASPGQAFMHTYPLLKRRDIQREFHSRSAAEWLAVGSSLGQQDAMSSAVMVGFAANDRLVGRVLTPGFIPFAEGGIIVADNIYVPAELRHEQFVEKIKDRFTRPGMLTWQPGEKVASTRPTIVDNNRLEIQQDIAITLVSQEANKPMYMAEAVLYLTSDPGPLSPARMPVWTVQKLEVTRAGLAAQDRQNAGMPGTPPPRRAPGLP